jgi:hypothetical protein
MKSDELKLISSFINATYNRFKLNFMNTLYKKFGAGILTLVIFVVQGVAMIPKTNASVDTWQKGITIEPRWTTDFGSDTFKQSVNNLAATHANYVSLIVPYYQSNSYSTDIQAGWNTPTDASLTQGIQYIHSKGMRAMLVIHLESYDGQWRANINPGDRAGWYANYSTMASHVATIAQQAGAESFIIGAELINMASQIANPDNATQWGRMIDHVRTIYHGQISYSANWGDGGWYDEKDYINFWDKLDFIGISGYFNLNTNGDVNSLKGAWDVWNNNQIRPLSQKWNKPVVFTEIGYRSVSGAHYHPWDYGSGGSIDQNEQAQDYEALFEYWNTQSFFQGVQFWVWSSDPNAGGPGTDTYTPQGKMAQGVLTQWFGSAAASNSQPANAAFNASGNISQGTLSTGQSINLQAFIQDTGSAIQGVIVDLEVRDQNNHTVFQKSFEGQSFAANENKTYSANWVPTTAGQYRYAVGVFNSNWTNAYTWNDNVASFYVNQGTSSTPTPTPAPTASSFTSTGGPRTTTPVTNQPLPLQAQIQNTGAAISGVISDLEIRDSNNQKVFQKSFENQNFPAGQFNQYTADWTPTSAGQYRMTIGVFNSSWSTAYHWNDSAATFSVSNGTSTTPTPTPSPTSGTVNVWWPTSGSVVTGVQPFKAVVDNRDISQYNMYWQVDGDQLNAMGNSSAGWPHKESLVDLSGWNWNSSGLYHLNFVAKDLSGAMINQKSVDIHTK